MRVVLLSLATMWAFSCAPSSDEDTPLPPAEGEIEQFELQPSSALLTNQGDTTRLTLVGYEEDGTAVGPAGEVMWVSSDPAQVAVDATGTVVATTGVGSAVVTAYVDGKPAKPMMVVVAPPVDGAVLISDTRIVEAPIPTVFNEETLEASEWQVTLTDDDALTEGTLMVSEGQTPLRGTVRAIESVAGGVQVTYTPATMEESFKDWNIDVRMPYTLTTDDVAEGWTAEKNDDGSWRFSTDDGRRSADDDWKCTGPEGGVEISLGAKFNHFNPGIQYIVENRRGETERYGFIIDATFELQISGTLSVPAIAFSCKLTPFGSITIPVSPYTDALLQPAITPGLKTGWDPGVPLPDLTLTKTITGSWKDDFGIKNPVGPAQWTIFHRDIVDESEAGVRITDSEWDLSAPFIEEGFRLQPKIFGGVYMDLGIHSLTAELAALAPGVEYNGPWMVLETYYGNKISADLATNKTQIQDTEYRSQANLDLVFGLKGGLERTLDLLNLSLEFLDYETTLLELANTPHGSATLTSTDIRPGVPVDIELRLVEGEKFLSFPNVSKIKVKRVIRDESGYVDDLIDEDTIEIDGHWENPTIWSYTPTTDDLNEKTEFAFFVIPRLFLPWVPLEISDDAVVSLDGCDENGFNRIPNGDFENPDGGWQVAGDTSATSYQVPGYQGIQPYDNSDYFGKIGWVPNTDKVYGNLRRPIGNLPAGRYLLEGKYRVYTEYYVNLSTCNSLTHPGLTIGIGSYASGDWELLYKAGRDGEYYQPKYYYCSDATEPRGDFWSFEDWKTITHTFVVDESVEDAYIFLHTFGGTRYDGHQVLFDNLSLREENCD